MFAKIQRFLRVANLRARGARIGKSLQSFDRFFYGEASGFTCGDGGYISSDCKIFVVRKGDRVARLTMGDRIYLNHYVIIDCHHDISIGTGVLIGPFSYICDYDHAFAPGIPVGSQNERPAKPVRIGDNVWLGAGAIVLKGVTIGDGAVVGAGSVVTHDVEPNSIVAGAPARLVRMR